ncbi:MAG: hypothetical protein AAF623_21025 [Planctomycetota bacterium]
MKMICFLLSSVLMVSASFAQEAATQAPVEQTVVSAPIIQEGAVVEAPAAAVEAAPAVVTPMTTEITPAPMTSSCCGGTPVVQSAPVVVDSVPMPTVGCNTCGTPVASPCDPCARSRRIVVRRATPRFRTRRSNCCY